MNTTAKLAGAVLAIGAAAIFTLMPSIASAHGKVECQNATMKMSASKCEKMGGKAGEAVGRKVQCQIPSKKMSQAKCKKFGGTVAAQTGKSSNKMPANPSTTPATSTGSNNQMTH